VLEEIDAGTEETDRLYTSTVEEYGDLVSEYDKGAAASISHQRKEPLLPKSVIPKIDANISKNRLVLQHLAFARTAAGSSPLTRMIPGTVVGSVLACRAPLCRALDLPVSPGQHGGGTPINERG